MNFSFCQVLSSQRLVLHNVVLYNIPFLGVRELSTLRSVGLTHNPFTSKIFFSVKRNIAYKCSSHRGNNITYYLNCNERIVHFHPTYGLAATVVI